MTRREFKIAGLIEDVADSLIAFTADRKSFEAGAADFVRGIHLGELASTLASNDPITERAKERELILGPGIVVRSLNSVTFFL
jgi:hypothetical protein